MEVTRLTQCPSCHGTGVRPVDLDGHALRRCTACGLVYAPEYGDPSSIYVDGYFTGGTEFGLDVQDPGFQRFLAHAAARRLDVIERAVGHRGSILDVGCGTGEVLAVGAERGWTVTGVEPIAESAEIARGRGLDVRNAMLEDSGLPQGSFDVVTAFHVIEHIPDGTAFLRSIARWAKPGGHVVIECPNYRSAHRVGHGGTWPNLRPLEHLAFYDTGTLATTLRRAGLEPVVVRTLGFLWAEQATHEMLGDLGLGRLHGVVTRLHPVARFQLLRAVERAYDVARVGQVVLAVAQTPA